MIPALFALAWASPPARPGNEQRPNAPAPPVELVPPAVLAAPPASERVLQGWLPACHPELLRAQGHDIVDPASPPPWLVATGVAPDDIRRTVDDLRGMVVSWIQGLERAGDDSLVAHTLCVGVYDDVRGANSFAAGGRWLFVGLRDLRTMHGAHGAGMSAAVEYTVAHELGHLLQQRVAMDFAGPTARAGELHADCLAGYLMAVDRGPRFSRVSELLARSEAHRIGDHHTGHPQHHGTPEERQKAFDRGWSAGLLAREGSASLRRSPGLRAACSAFATAP